MVLHSGRLRYNQKTLDWRKSPATDKHSSLLQKLVKYGGNVLILGPWSQSYKAFWNKLILYFCKLERFLNITIFYPVCSNGISQKERICKLTPNSFFINLGVYSKHLIFV